MKWAPNQKIKITKWKDLKRNNVEMSTVVLPDARCNIAFGKHVKEEQTESRGQQLLVEGWPISLLHELGVGGHHFGLWHTHGIGGWLVGL